jgi:hypothetical protein
LKKDKSIDSIKAEIAAKKAADKTKLKNLGIFAALTLLLRLLLFVFSAQPGSILIELLWIPTFLFVFSLPFYA